MRTTILTAATIGLITFGLAGCDEPAYEGGHERQAATAEPPPPSSQRPTIGGSTGSALGPARRAADRTADRMQQNQDRTRRAIEGEDDD